MRPTAAEKLLKYINCRFQKLFHEQRKCVQYRKLLLPAVFGFQSFNRVKSPHPDKREKAENMAIKIKRLG